MLRKNGTGSCENCSLVCGNCDFYDPGLEVEVYETVGQIYSMSLTASGSCGLGSSLKVKKKGACKLNPHPIHKATNDWCGQHSAYGK